MIIKLNNRPDTSHLYEIESYNIDDTTVPATAGPVTLQVDANNRAQAAAIAARAGWMVRSVNMVG